MYTYHLMLSLGSALLFGASQASFACNQTLSPGANLASAISSAPANSTICLNTGIYGSVNLYNINRSAYVTVKSVSGKGASIAPQMGNTKFVRFESLTISSDVLQNSCSANIQWVNNDFTGRGLTLSNSGCSNLNTLIDGNNFSNFTVGGGYEGRLSLVYGSGIIVTNNFFGNGGASDGIQLLGNVSNVNIGPGNTFSGIKESLCGAVHCDAIQLYGAGTNISITGNYFSDGDAFIMAPDGSSGVTVTNNVFNGTGYTYIDKVQFGTAESPIFEHNTLINVRASFDSKVGEAASSNVVGRNNILISGSSFKTANGSGCSSCTFTRNLFSSTSYANGTNNLTGNPTFIGGSSPTNWAGYQLMSNSLGYKAATDGNDMGPIFSTTAITPLATPSNLRFQ